MVTKVDDPASFLDQPYFQMRAVLVSFKERKNDITTHKPFQGSLGRTVYLRTWKPSKNINHSCPMGNSN